MNFWKKCRSDVHLEFSGDGAFLSDTSAFISLENWTEHQCLDGNSKYIHPITGSLHSIRSRVWPTLREASFCNLGCRGMDKLLLVDMCRCFYEDNMFIHMWLNKIPCKDFSYAPRWWQETATWRPSSLDASRQDKVYCMRTLPILVTALCIDSACTFEIIYLFMQPWMPQRKCFMHMLSRLL